MFFASAPPPYGAALTLIGPTGSLARVDLQALQRDFASLYGRPADGAVRAPGRVNLIGEHTDYNDGFVLPIAIERQTVGICGRRSDGTIRFASEQAESRIVPVDLSVPVVAGQPAWANYCRGVAAGLLAAGIELVGMDVLFDSNVPVGGGLSSSAALEVATALALLEAAGRRDAVFVGNRSWAFGRSIGG